MPVTHSPINNSNPSMDFEDNELDIIQNENLAFNLNEKVNEKILSLISDDDLKKSVESDVKKFEDDKPNIFVFNVDKPLRADSEDENNNKEDNETLQGLNSININSFKGHQDTELLEYLSETFRKINSKIDGNFLKINQKIDKSHQDILNRQDEILTKVISSEKKISAIEENMALLKVECDKGFKELGRLISAVTYTVMKINKSNVETTISGGEKVSSGNDKGNSKSNYTESLSSQQQETRKTFSFYNKLFKIICLGGEDAISSDDKKNVSHWIITGNLRELEKFFSKNNAKYSSYIKEANN